MVHHLYADLNGNPVISDHTLDPELFFEFRYLGESAERPDVEGKLYVGGKWVSAGSEPEYVRRRRKAYPSMFELFEALWQAMEDGVLPKVPGFYDRIKAVRDRFPPK